jgi:hypothetical protein
MKRCPECGHTRSWRLADGRLRCRRCRTRYRWTSAWDGVRLSEATKRRLLELFVFGVPSYRLRFRAGVSAPTIERFFRLVRACMALAEDLRAPFEGAVECDEAVFGGRRRGTKRGWGAPGKVIVVGILKRNGYVRVRAIDTHSERETVNLVCTHTRPGSRWRCAESMWWYERSAADLWAVTTSTVSKGSGVTPNIGSIRTVECRANSFTFIWVRLRTDSTTETRTFSLC